MKMSIGELRHLIMHEASDDVGPQPWQVRSAISDWILRNDKHAITPTIVSGMKAMITAGTLDVPPAGVTLYRGLAVPASSLERWTHMSIPPGQHHGRWSTGSMQFSKEGPSSWSLSIAIAAKFATNLAWVRDRQHRDEPTCAVVVEALSSKNDGNFVDVTSIDDRYSEKEVMAIAPVTCSAIRWRLATGTNHFDLDQIAIWQDELMSL